MRGSGRTATLRLAEAVAVARRSVARRTTRRAYAAATRAALEEVRAASSRGHAVHRSAVGGAQQLVDLLGGGAHLVEQLVLLRGGGPYQR